MIICLLFHLPTFMARGPSRPAYHCLSAQFAPLWRAARHRSERSVGGPVIICLLFLLPTFMAHGLSGPAFHCLSAQLWRAARAGQLIITFVCNLPPLWRAARPRSERSVGSPVIICLLFYLPTFMARGPSVPPFHCLSAQVSPVMARGPNGPAYHCFLRNLPRLWRAAHPRRERSVGGQLSFVFCFINPPLWRAARAGQPFIAFLPNFPPLWCAAEAGLFIIAFLCNLPPLWRAACPRSERSVGSQLSFAFCFICPPLWGTA